MKDRFIRAYRAFNAPIPKMETRNQYESWWSKPGPELNDSWIEKFCAFHQIPPLQFISCYKNRETIQKSKHLKTVFFSGEHLQDRFKEYDDHMIGQVDYSIGFDKLEHPNYLRFPLWLLYFTAPNTKNPGKDFVAAFSRKWTSDRPFFCSQISSHDERGNGRGLRTSCSSALAEIGEVLNVGRLLNNSKILQEKYHNNPHYFLRDCRFNICLENSYAPGYVTEKIFRPLLCGAIPIYWGDPNPESNIINPNSFLRYDSENPESLIKAVGDLEENEGLRSDFIHQNKIQEGAADWINEIHHTLADELRNLQ